MPRRNNRRRQYAFLRPTEDKTPAPSYEALARQLVASGKCSPLILDHPKRFNERTHPHD